MRWIDQPPFYQIKYPKENRMYIVKKNNRKLTTKEFKSGFTSYDEAKNAVRKLLRSLGVYEGGFKAQGYSIEAI